MKDRKLAMRYARALLSLLPDPHEAETVDRFLAGIREGMEEAPVFRELMIDPAVPRGRRVSILHDLAERAGAPRVLRHFLSTLVEHNRTGALPSIAETFRAERERRMGIVQARITSAAPLAGELVERSRETLERMTGRRVRLTCSVEPALIGGAVTRIGSMVYDGSLRTQLARLREKMAQE